MTRLERAWAIGVNGIQRDAHARSVLSFPLWLPNRAKLAGLGRFPRFPAQPE
jgi:hypothetical protein